LIKEGALALTDSTEYISHMSSNIFLPSIIFYWIFQFLIILILGNIFVKKDKANFFSIFVFIQLIGAIILFFTFIYPVFPDLLGKLFT